jgi:hypothetical protein
MRRTISLDELNNFELDDNGRLYWLGNQVILEQRLVISRWVNVSIVATGIATVALAAFSALSYFWPLCP